MLPPRGCPSISEPTCVSGSLWVAKIEAGLSSGLNSVNIVLYSNQALALRLFKKPGATR